MQDELKRSSRHAEPLLYLESAMPEIGRFSLEFRGTGKILTPVSPG